ncbi:MAG: hypothetical protein HC821_01410 [Lewinella sp.]|nr:hypothetical protein [Lewinella sp.]
MAALALGSLGLSAAFSFVAAISTRAGGGATLLSVLSFPLVIPLLLLLVQAGSYALGLQSSETASTRLLGLLGALDLLLIGVGLLLFPFVGVIEA